jgi:hypothetical protein
VGSGELGAFAEELGAGLEVRDTAVEEVKGIALEGRKLGSKEGCDKIGAGNGLAKVMSPGGELGIIAGARTSAEGLAEVGGVRWRERRDVPVMEVRTLVLERLRWIL